MLKINRYYDDNTLTNIDYDTEEDRWTKHNHVHTELIHVKGSWWILGCQPGWNDVKTMKYGELASHRPQMASFSFAVWHIIYNIL